jgi:ketosteroid isomerase-like protein
MRQMRRMLATAFMVACISGLMFSQADANTGAGDSAGVEQQVKQYEKQIRESVLKGDTSALEQYLADDYLAVNQAGKVVDKNQTIQDIKSGKLKYSSITIKDESIRTYGDTAIRSVLVRAKLSYDGKEESGDYRVTAVSGQAERPMETRLVAINSRATLTLSEKKDEAMALLKPKSRRFLTRLARVKQIVKQGRCPRPA